MDLPSPGDPPDLTPGPAGPDEYRTLLGRLDAWFVDGRERARGIVPCAGGCSACCHGPFDVSVADLELLRAGVAELPDDQRREVESRARGLLGQMESMEPEWKPPHDIAAIGDERFDELCDALAGEPCPLLDHTGRCRVYDHRPLVCRLIGLGMAAPRGRVIENTCPIQHRFPGYPSLPPKPFDLDRFEEEETVLLEAAAVRLFDDPGRAGFETTIAAAVARPLR